MSNIIPPTGYELNPEAKQLEDGVVYFRYNFKDKQWVETRWHNGQKDDGFALCAWPAWTPVKALCRHRFSRAQLFRNEVGELMLHKSGKSVSFEILCEMNGWKFYDCVKNMKVAFSWDEYGNLRSGL